MCIPKGSISHSIHVWYIYLHLPLKHMGIFNSISFNIHMSWRQHQPINLRRILFFVSRPHWCDALIQPGAFDLETPHPEGPGLFLVGKVSKKPWNFAWNLWDQLDIEFLEHAFIKHLYQKKIAFIIWFQIRYQNLFVVYKFIGFHLCFFFKSLSVAIFFQPNLLSNKKPSTSAAFSLSANSAC